MIRIWGITSIIIISSSAFGGGVLIPEEIVQKLQSNMKSTVVIETTIHVPTVKNVQQRRQGGSRSTALNPSSFNQMVTTPASIQYEERKVPDYARQTEAVAAIATAIKESPKKEEFLINLNRVGLKYEPISGKLDNLPNETYAYFQGITSVPEIDPKTGEPVKHDESTSTPKLDDALQPTKDTFDAAASRLGQEYKTAAETLAKEQIEALQKAQEEVARQNNNLNTPTPTAIPPQQQAGSGSGGGGSGGGAGGGKGGGGLGDMAKGLDQGAISKGMASLFDQPRPKQIDIDPSAFGSRPSGDLGDRGIASINPITLSNSTPPIAASGKPLGESAGGNMQPQVASNTLVGSKSNPQALSNPAGIPATNQPGGDSNATPKLGGTPNQNGSLVSGDPYQGNGLEKPYKPVNYNLVKDVGYGSAGGGGESVGEGEPGSVDGGADGTGGSPKASIAMKGQQVLPAIAIAKDGPKGIMAYTGLIRTICMSPRGKSVGICKNPGSKLPKADTVAMAN